MSIRYVGSSGSKLGSMNILITWNILVTRYILGLKTEESQVILGFLFNHITSSPDIQCRVTWEQGTTIVYDV
jgi:alpha-ketoglutarate-dependent taurine dioxygenase